MDISAALLADLRRLSADPDKAAQLAAELRHLGDDVTVWVPSWLSVSIVVGGEPEIGVSILGPGIDAGVPVLSSLAVAVSDLQGGAQLIVRAGQPGAFLLLADALTIRAHPAHPIILDHHLDLPPTARGQAGVLADRGAIDQAIGVLLEEGFTFQEGRRELHRLAVATHLSLPAAAHRLLNSQNAPHNRDDVDTG